jgi:hypothetical protein
MEDQEYCVSIISESTGPGGKKYQRVILEQYFDDNDVQVDFQRNELMQIVGTIADTMVKFGERDMSRRKAKK